MAKIVEQVDSDGNIVMDYDTSLSRKRLFEVLSEHFPNLHMDKDGMIWGVYGQERYAIRAKNITYLGHPHPLFKKRIQIAGDLWDFYHKAKIQHRTPFLLGVYTYKDNLIFCDFNIEDFIYKKAHNSSAHIYTENLADATTDDYFEKEDFYGNHITAFSPKGVNLFLEENLGDNNDRIQYSVDTSYGRHRQVTVKDNKRIQYSDNTSKTASKVAEERHANSARGTDFILPGEIQDTIIEFFGSVDKHWDGLNCYAAMIKANYRNKYQPEWPGFYLEYEFENFLERHRYTDIIRYAQDKTSGGVDLDLFFPTIGMYGDLKAHTNTSRGIQGNDWNTVFDIISDRQKDRHIYYIVCEHETQKDSECDYVVTHYWNSMQKKTNLMSYHKRMKNNVDLTRALILDINDKNKGYLSKFRQGINSNGKPREPKIMIDYDKMDQFILLEKNL